MRIELTPMPDPQVPFRFRLGDRVKAPATGKEGRIVAGRYEGPVPIAGVVLAYAIEYVVRDEQGREFLALEVELESA